MRLTRQETEVVKKQFGVDRIWSYSRLSTYVSQKWVYRMTYLDPRRIYTDNVYTVMGTICHDIIQDYAEGKTDYKSMIERFDDEIMKWRLDANSHKFMNEKVEQGYLHNIKHYFKHTETIPYEVKNEKPVCITFKKDSGENIVFVGYMDSIFTDNDGNFHIMDYKTSSKGDYIGKKLKEHSKQLQLYSIGIHQLKGIPYDKIKPQFDMMKYVKVSYLQKNGKWRDSIQERATWVISQEKKIRSLLSEHDVDILEMDLMVGNANFENNLSSLPDYVQEKFKVGNCYIDVEINEEIEKELRDFVITNIEECEIKEQGDLDIEFPEPIIDESNKFYFEVLAKQLLKYHKGYQESLHYRVNGHDIKVDELADLFK